MKVQFLEKKKLLHPFFETNFLRTVRFAPRYIMIYEFLQKFLIGGTRVNRITVEFKNSNRFESILVDSPPKNFIFTQKKNFRI